MTNSRLSGLRVLVLEDDFLVAEGIRHMLMDMGCEVVGPAATVDMATDLVKSQQVDAAVLDIRLSRGTSAPLARLLRYRSCPFLFVTGYSPQRLLPEDLLGSLILTKPVAPKELETALGNLTNRHARTV